jgi:hypothetical protein
VADGSGASSLRRWLSGRRDRSQSHSPPLRPDLKHASWLSNRVLGRKIEIQRGQDYGITPEPAVYRRRRLDAGAPSSGGVGATFSVGNRFWDRHLRRRRLDALTGTRDRRGSTSSQIGTCRAVCLRTGGGPRRDRTGHGTDFVSGNAEGSASEAETEPLRLHQVVITAKPYASTPSKSTTA